jgi:hypothetical protein
MTLPAPVAAAVYMRGQHAQPRCVVCSLLPRQQNPQNCTPDGASFSYDAVTMLKPPSPRRRRLDI